MFLGMVLLFVPNAFFRAISLILRRKYIKSKSIVAHFLLFFSISCKFCVRKNLEPQSVIGLLCANETFFLSSVSSLLGYNGTPLRPQSDKTPVER